MDILIKNMEMPKDNDYLHLIIQGGKVHTAISCGHLTTDKLNVADAIEVKPHGRLIDADAIISKIERMVHPDDLTYTIAYGILKQIVEDAPTIVEATE